MADAITIHNTFGDLKIPLHPTNNTFRRVADDISFIGKPSVGIPVWVEFILSPDGILTHWKTDWTTEYDQGFGTLGFSRLVFGRVNDAMPESQPTEAQRNFLARLWLKQDRTETFGLGLNDAVCNWAFKGMTPDEVNEKYGDCSPLFLSGDD
jgi:hypothetical protein